MSCIIRHVFTGVTVVMAQGHYTKIFVGVRIRVGY